MSVQNVQQSSTDSSLIDNAKARENKYDTLLHKRKFRSKPIVYTTRLDDMNVITKNILHNDILWFIRCIIKESKPIYNGKQVHPEPYVNKLMSYLILKYKINMYNTIVKSSNKKNQLTQMKNMQSNCDSERTKSIEFIQLLPDRLSSLNSADDFTIPENSITEKVYKTMRKSKNRYPSKKYIIIKNHNSKETDVYFFNKTEDVFEHYKSEDDNYNVLKFYYNHSKAKEFNHCCWYQSITDIMSNTTVQYLRKEHKCTPADCKCCCNKYATDISNYYTKSKKQAFLVIQPKDPLLVLSDNSESNAFHNDAKTNDLSKTLCKEDRKCDISIDILQGPLTSGNLIKKALNYNPVINLRNLSCPAYQTEFLKYVIVEISNHKTCIYEWYKIGSDGEIEDYYIKHFENSDNYNKEQICALNNDAEYNKIATDVCCWYARKNFIDHLHLKKLLPSSLKFIMSSLYSYKEKCENCQILSQSVSKSNNHIDLTLPEHHVYHSSNKVLKQFELKKNVTLMMQPKSQLIDSCSLVEKNENQNINLKAPITCTTKVQHTQSHVLLHPTVSTPITTDIMTKLCTEDLECKADSTEVKILINTILEKFKGIQLFVNENGKISARFNSSVNTLNAKDIQMLNQIIEQAQSELDALGSHNSQTGLENPLRFPQFTGNSSTLLENVMQKNLSTQKNNNITTDPSSFDIAANIAIINNDTSTTINNTLLHGEFLTLMKEKKEHYLKAFECYLMAKQDSLTSIIKSVPATKRKTIYGKGSSKRIKVDTASKLLQSSKINNPKHEIVDNVSVKSKKYNDNRNMPGASKMVHTPKPVAIIPTPHLQNLLIPKAPTSALHSEHTQETILSSDKSYDSETPRFSNPLISGVAVNIHDTLFKVEESTVDDAILGV